MRIETAKQLLEKNKRDWEKIAENFSATRNRLWPELKKFSQYVKNGDTILDLGCGNGRLYELFKDKSIKYIGVDSCKKLIEIAKQKYSISNVQYPPVFQAADASNLPFKEESFDEVFSVALLHHIPSEKLRLEIVDEARRVLKTNGTLIITSWNLYQIDFWPRLLKYTVFKLFRKQIKELQVSNFKLQIKNLDFGDVFIPWKLRSDEIVQRYYHAFSLHELRWLLERCGFKIIDQYYSEKGRRASWWNGYNIVIIAQKK